MEKKLRISSKQGSDDEKPAIIIWNMLFSTNAHISGMKALRTKL
tara:strand:- start:604 stop:735 length:132 start_codon:yes stop_codon:yes gene_type:complete